MDLIKIKYKGDQIKLKNKDGFYSLTDLWKASGVSDNYKPGEWSRKPREKKSGTSTKISKSGGPGWEFINYISELESKGGRNPPLKTVRGKYGGTYAHWQIALAYAKYLSPELHAQMNLVFKERLEEDRSPELGIDRAVSRAKTSYEKSGKDKNWIAKRIMSKGVHLHFAGTLKDHGCDGMGIGMCVNTQYIELFGGKVNALKEKRGLKKAESLRDNMSQIEIAQLILAETLATDRIESDKAQGPWSCNKRSKLAAKSVSLSVANFNAPDMIEKRADVEVDNRSSKELEEARVKARAAFFKRDYI